jgi:transcriptional regulator with XRE-family HTH domain
MPTCYNGIRRVPMRAAAECLGENVKRLRLERGFTQQELSKRAKVSLSFLQNIETGKKWAGPKTLAALSRALKVSESELFADCLARPSLDGKEVLAMLARMLGVVMDEAMIAGLRTRPSPFHLVEMIPEDICSELIVLCREPGWDWEGFRVRMRG